MTPSRPLSWLLALILLAAPALVHANVGDDLKTLRQRYGSAKEVGNQMLFQHNGYSICAYFDGAHVGMEVFCRDGSIKDKTDITDKDVADIMAAQGEGLPWSPYTSPRGKPLWIRSDHKLIVRISTGTDKFVTVMLNDKYDGPK